MLLSLSATYLSVGFSAPLTQSILTWFTVYFALIAGGRDPISNEQSHQEHILGLISSLEQRQVSSDQITLFWADGLEPGVDRRLPEPRTDPLSWVTTGTPWEGWMEQAPLLANTTWEGIETRPAKRSALRSWIKELSPKLKPHDVVFFAVTDHGAPDPTGGWRTSIELWGEQLNVDELYQDLQLIPSEVHIQLWMSQCYSGGFAKIAAMDQRVCGAFSAAANRPAYGCTTFPTQRGMQGHFTTFTEALSKVGRLDFASRYTAEHDETPDTPHLSSDAFARRIVSERSEALGIPADHLVDHALPRSGALNPSQREITQSITQTALRFNLGLVHSYSRAIQLSKEVNTLIYALEAWRAQWLALTHEARLRLLHTAPIDGLTQEKQKRRRRSQRVRLKRWIKRALKRGEEGRRGLLKDLYGRLNRAERLLDQLKTVEASLWRIATLYISLAAKQILSSHDAQIWERMRSCEARPAITPIMPFASHSPRGDDTTRISPSLPPLSELRAEVESLRPGYLAFRYRERSRAKLLEVRGVDLGSPLWAVDLRTGDTIDMVDGGRLTYLGQMKEEVALHPVGEPLKIRRRRDGKARTLHVPVVGMPLSPKPPQKGDLIPPLLFDPIQEDNPIDHLMTGGRSTLLFFWATWCKTCLSITPQLKRWAQQHNIQVLAVTAEDPHLVKAVSQSTSLPFPIFHDRGREATRLFGADLQTLDAPVFVYLDVERRFIERGVGMGTHGPNQIELLFE